MLTSVAVGGAERVAYLLASAQRARGYQVIVVSLENPPAGSLTQAFEQADVRVVRVPKRPGFDVSLYARLLACFRRESVTVVHTHNPLPLIYAAPAGRLARARVVHTKHGPHPCTGMPLMLKRIGAACSDAFVAVSDATAAYAREIREVAPAKLQVILNATDLAKFRHDEAARSRLREHWNIGLDQFVIGTVGRVAPEKDHALLLHAAAPLIAEGAFLVLAGDGPERSRLEALARELGIEARTRFLGEVHEVEAVMSAFDVFALSSRVEGLPMVLVEAMGASLPIVATAVGGVPKVVQPGVTGHLVARGDQQALESALRAVRDDRAGAAQMGMNGCHIAQQSYALDRMVNDYLATYSILQSTEHCS
ncbi:MAG: glycosyltransferase [Myxococcales bacterium]